MIEVFMREIKEGKIIFRVKLGLGEVFEKF